MNQPPTDSELGGMLRRILMPMGPILRFERIPSEYASSYPLEELTIWLSDGQVLKVMMKDVGRDSLSQDAQLAKPIFLRDPWREITAYRVILPLTENGPPKFYGAEVDEAAGRFLIFIEKLPGVELFQVGDLNVWQAVARWLAKFHLSTAGAVASSPSQLIYYDANLYRTWARRALELAQNLTSPARKVLENYEPFVERLLHLPRNCIHGEFYASNVLVDRQPAANRVGPVDWEMAAVGPGLIDLAALIAGNWTDDKRTAISLAYFEAFGPHEQIPDSTNFLWLLDHARLHLAVQWLGWSDRWVPPKEHRHDWMAEMIHLAERIGRKS
jgi:hypothetical protein